MEDLSIFTNLEDFRLDIPTTAPLSPGQSTVPSDSRLSNDDGGLDGFFYIPNFISIEEERYLLQKVGLAIDTNDYTQRSFVLLPSHRSFSFRSMKRLSPSGKFYSIAGKNSERMIASRERL